MMEECAKLVVLELGEAIAACRSGAIPDMKTEIGLLRLADHLGYLPQLGCFVDELPPELAARHTPLGVSGRSARGQTPESSAPMTHPPRRILVRVPTWIGDAVMATPVFRALRAAHPEAEIALEGRPVLEALLRGLPSFDRFLPDPGGGLRAMLARARGLREHGFDWAVLLPDSQRAALGPFLARIPRRVGYARDPLRRLLLSEALAPPRAGRERLPIPMTERYLRISRQLGCPDRGSELELAVDPAEAERCEARLRELGAAPEAPILVVTPGASFGASKLWPPAHFAAACDGIAQRLGLLPVLAPGPMELAIAQRIAAAARGTHPGAGRPAPPPSSR